MGDTEGLWPYQGVDAGEGLVGVVQGVEQLENPVVGLAVPVEADANGRTVGREGALVRGEGHARPATPAGQGTLP